MSDERNYPRSPSPTLNELIGLPNDWDLVHPEDEPPASEQNTSTPDSHMDQEGLTQANTPSTVNEDNAIELLLQNCSSPEQLLQFVKIHKAAKEAGIHKAFDIVSRVQPAELLERICTIEARLPPTIPTFLNVPVPPAVPSSIKLEREPSEDFDKKSGSSRRGAKRARTVYVGKDQEHKIAPESKKMKRRGCPGGIGRFGICKPTELKTEKTCWSSFTKFHEHFQTHLESYRIKEHGWQCLLCGEVWSGGDGCTLAQHIWKTHF